MSNTEENSRLIKLDQRAAIFDKEGNILVVKTEFGWDFPGGLLASGNNWRESLEEQISDQLSLQVMSEQPFFAADFVHPQTGEYTYMVVVKCLAFTDEFENSSFEEVKWISAAEAIQLNFVNYELREALSAIIE